MISFMYINELKAGIISDLSYHMLSKSLHQISVMPNA